MTSVPTNQVLTTTSAEQTRNFGKSLVTQLQPGDLITLQGELGAGKTTLVQGVAAGLKIEEGANSPTFVLIVEHEGKLPLLHLDAYRLEGAMGESICYDALRDAGVLDLLDREDAVKVIEWPQRLAEILPTPRFAIEITPGQEENERVIHLRGYSR